MNRRTGYILIFVLGLATVISSLGIAFIQANGTAMPEANNRMYAARAQYLADSGVELAKHYLMYPPTSVAYNGYWPGGNRIAIDNGPDYANVTVTAHEKHLNRYLIKSAGVAVASSGAVMGKKSVTVDVIAPSDPRWSFSRALIARGTVTINSITKVIGDIHSNGNLIGSGWCNGKVSACGTAVWTGGGPPTTVASLAPAVALPSAVTSYYTNYTLHGKTYAAYAVDKNQFDATDAVTLNAIDMTTTNPGRIIMVRSGDFKLKNGAKLNGTLLVSGGNLTLENDCQITAVVGFPAVVCTGEILSQGNDQAYSIIGSVLCGNRLNTDGKKNISLSITGTTIIANQTVNTNTGNQFNLTGDVNRSWFYDFESPRTKTPITVLSWQES